MSKRKNRLLREREATEQLMRSSDYVAGAQASGIPEAINPAFAQVDTRRMVETAKQGSMRSTGSAVAEGHAPTPDPLSNTHPNKGEDC